MATRDGSNNDEDNQQSFGLGYLKLTDMFVIRWKKNILLFKTRSFFSPSSQNESPRSAQGTRCSSDYLLVRILASAFNERNLTVQLYIIFIFAYIHYVKTANPFLSFPDTKFRSRGETGIM